MKKLRLLFLFPFVFFFVSGYGQQERLREADQLLYTSFQVMISAEPVLRSDSLAPAFLKLMKQSLLDPLTFENDLDSLAKVITIKVSGDKKVKFYSWDERSGGTWHTINCVAQFRSERGKIVVQQLSGGEGETGAYTDSRVYDVRMIFIDAVPHYLTFASGTHGSGRQHQLLRVFNIQGDSFVKNSTCLPPDGELVLEYPRSERLLLLYDPRTFSVSYREFYLQEDVGVYRPTGKTVVLYLTNGVFKEQ